MEIILSDERDERFIDFCASFDCVLDVPQVVLLLINQDSTIACTSFKVHDTVSVEIISLFVKKGDFEEISYKLLKQLEKIAIDLDFKAAYVELDDSDELLINIFKKIDYKMVDDGNWMKKEFRSLI